MSSIPRSLSCFNRKMLKHVAFIFRYLQAISDCRSQVLSERCMLQCLSNHEIKLKHPTDGTSILPIKSNSQLKK